MRIAIDISPISKQSSSAHKVRGVGSYINLLVENLPKYDRKNHYVFVEDKKFPDNVDLIHYPYFDPFFITLPVKSNKKFVVTVHDLTPLVFPHHFPAGLRGNAKWLLQKHLLRRSAAIIADSDCSSRDIIRIVKLRAEKVSTVYLSADKQFTRINTEDIKKSKIRDKYKLPEEFLLYVGDATWNKNLPRLIAAVKKTKYRLVLVGKVWEAGDVGQNSWNNDLKNVSSEIENDDQFIKLGFVQDEDIVKIYNLATCLIMPSIYEGFGLPVLEAMNCGCPVITTEEGSLPEVAESAALYIDAFDIKSIENGISKVCASPELQKELSQKGLKQAEKFTIEKTIHDTIKVYESI